MPTLIEYSAGETARASDIAWLERELHDGESGDANETTLSGSVLAQALEGFRRSQQQQHRETASLGALSPITQKQNVDQSISLLASPDLLAPETPHVESSSPVEQSQRRLLRSPDLMPPQTPHLDVPGSEFRKSVLIVAHTRENIPPGPNQQAYEKHYKDFVAKAVRDCREKHPNQIPNYKELSPEKQRSQQERVLRLLERLQLGGRNAVDKDDDGEATCQTPHQRKDNKAPSEQNEQSFDRLDHSETHYSPEQANDSVVDTSMALLSPTPVKNPSLPSSSASPVEISRAAAPFSSPSIVVQRQLQLQDSFQSDRKRLATTSGKRGADSARRRRAQEADADESVGGLLSMDLSSPQPKIFSASQSPILSDSDDDDDDDDNNLRQKHRNNQEEDDSSASSVGANISIGGGDLPDDADDTFDDSINETAMGVRSALAANGNEVHLKAGATVHFQPLETKRRRPQTKVLTQTFPDPFDTYSGKARDKMKVTYQWLRRRIQSTSVPGGIVFGLSGRKIVDLCTKLATRAAELNEDCETSDKQMLGQTLIVLRERSSLEEWKRVFREGSNLGVLSHCELPVKERKSASTALKCLKYNVVLTTFDALSSPDSNVVICDEDGTAMAEQNRDQDGWFQGRGSSQSQPAIDNCVKLSILHRLKWKQAIFIDNLGRKSYLAKPGTSRNKAATVLAAEARVLFFEKDQDSSAGFGELVKSDKKALSGVAAVLHTDWDRVGDGDYQGKGISLDYAHALRIRTTSHRRKNN